MKYRLLLFLNYTKKIFNNPSRMALTLSGLILSVIILMIGLIFSETYFNSRLVEIEKYKEYNAYVVEGVFDYDIYCELSTNGGEINNIELISGFKYKVKTIESDGKRVSVYIKDIRTDKVMMDFLSCSENGTLRYSAELKQGRLLNASDLENKANVTVIGETLAEIMFGNENPIGKKLTFPVFCLNEKLGVMEVEYYEELEIVGVITDSKVTKENAKNALIEKTELNEIDTLVYVPLSCEVADRENNDYTMRITKYSKDVEYYDDVMEYERIVNSEDNYYTYSYFSLKNGIASEIETIRRVIFYIVLFMFIISALCIANTMFFSVKERISEIGIRKSMGAFDEDIIIQFVYEGMVYGVIGSVIGVVFSILLASIIYIIMGGYEIWNTHLSVSLEIVILSFLISVTIGTISSIIPSLYGAKIKIVDAIKYD